MVITDEVYGHMIFGNNPFIPMGVFGDIVPIITLGSISKRWVVPGWRLGWIVTTDPNGILKKTKVCYFCYYAVSFYILLYFRWESYLLNIYFCYSEQILTCVSFSKILQVVDSIKNYLAITSDPATFIQVLSSCGFHLSHKKSGKFQDSFKISEFSLLTLLINLSGSSSSNF